MSSTPGRRRRAPGHGQAGARRRSSRTGCSTTLDAGRRASTVTLPAGVFRLTDGDGDVVAFAGGSGITPGVLAPQVGAGHDRRDGSACCTPTATATPSIFAAEHRRPGRRATPTASTVVHHLDVDDGFVDADAVRRASSGARDRRRLSTSAGPAPFMDIVEDDAARATGVDAGSHPHRALHARASRSPTPSRRARGRRRRTRRRRSPSSSTAAPTPPSTAPARPILQTARQIGMSPPFSCESGSCATCMAQARRGHGRRCTCNNALDRRRGRRGLGAHLPVRADHRPSVHVVYGFEDMSDGTAADARRHHRDRAAARPLRGGHDQGRHRRRHRGVHPRRHLQRVRRHLRARRLPDAGRRRAEGPVHGRAARRSSSTATPAPASSRCASSTRPTTTCASAGTPTPTGAPRTAGGCTPGR